MVSNGLLSINERGLKNAKEILDSANTNLANARNQLTGITMPEKFSYSARLRTIPSSIQSVEKQVSGIKSYIDQKIKDYRKAEEAAKNLANALGKSLAGLSMKGPSIVGNLLQQGRTTNTRNSSNIPANMMNNPDYECYKNWEADYKETASKAAGNLGSGLGAALGRTIDSATGALMAGVASTINKASQGIANPIVSAIMQSMSQDIIKGLSKTNAKICFSVNMESETLEKALKMDLSDDDKKASENRKKYWDIAKMFDWDHAKEKESKARTLEIYGDLNINPWDIKKIQNDSDKNWSVTLYDGTKVSYNYNYNYETSKSSGYIIVDHGDGMDLHISLSTDSFGKKSILKDGKSYMPEENIISESEKIQIREEFDLKEDANINGYVVIDINGNQEKVYWAGDDVNNYDYYKYVLKINKVLNEYPDNVVDRVFNSENFNGFVIGTPNSNNANIPYGFGYQGYALGDKYIAINPKSCSEDALYHEFAHIVDATLYDGTNGHYTEHDQKILNLYEKYKKTIQSLPISYDGKRFPDGVPNVKEFFAVTVEMYYTDSEDLKTLLPEVYDYTDNFLKSI